MESELPPFHLAFPVTDLAATRRFFVEALGCRVGREGDRWIDFDFHGHQISAHRVETMPAVPTNQVEDKAVPVAHFGLILEWEAWERLAARLREHGVAFLIEPHVRFEGLPGEQGTFFVIDPSGNGLEFKSFRRVKERFART